MKNILILTFIILLFSNCKPKKEQYTKSLDQKTHNLAITVLANNCISCHSSDSKIAPSFTAIKEAYLKYSANETEFANTMTNFLLSPTLENSKMPNKIKKFGIMPNLGMHEEQYNYISEYIYNTDIHQNDWINKLKKEVESLPKEMDTNYLKKGKEIALATKAVLGKNLLTAIKTKGTDKALTFCNEKAIHLTDSVSLQLNAKVKRVSDKNRNPNNIANINELAYINEVKQVLKAKGKIKPKIQKNTNTVVGYYPITTNKMCIQCHGNPNSDIDYKTFEIIKNKYPNDKAIGYSENELRGIWVIEMGK